MSRSPFLSKIAVKGPKDPCLLDPSRSRQYPFRKARARALLAALEMRRQVLAAAEGKRKGAEKRAWVSGTELAPFNNKPKAQLQKDHEKALGLRAVKQAQTILLPNTPAGRLIAQRISEQQRTARQGREARSRIAKGMLGGAAVSGSLAGLLRKPVGKWMVPGAVAGAGLGVLGSGMAIRKEEEFRKMLERAAKRKTAGISPETLPPTNTTKFPRLVIKGEQPTTATLPEGDTLAGDRLKQETEFKVARYLDPLNRRYPINTFEEVLEANAYMGKYASEFNDGERISFSTRLFVRSRELGIEPHPRVKESALLKVASADEVRGELFARTVFYGKNSEAGQMFTALMDKIGSLRPQVLAETISQLDAKYGGDSYWNSHIAAPFDVVFRKHSEDKNPSDYSYDFGTWRISGTDLVRLAKSSVQVDARFGSEFAGQFRLDPVGFFDHLPLPEKEVLARMAHDVITPGSNG